MKPYGEDYFRYKDCIRSTTKTAKLRAKNADRSKKKSVRNKVKIFIKSALEYKIGGHKRV